MELTKTYQLISSFNLTYGAMRTYAKYSNQSTSDNTTTYQIEQRYYCSNPYVGFDSATAVLDGTQKKYNSYTRMYEGETIIQTLNRVIEHNQDGSSPTKNIETSWSASFGGSGSTNVNITFPNISRYAILTDANEFNDEGNPSIWYYNPQGNNVTILDAYIEKQDSSATLVSSRPIPKTGNSYTFELTTSERNSLRNAYPNEKEVYVNFVIRTRLNNVDYYSAVTRKFSIVNANPTFNVAYQDTNATTLAITSNNQQIIQNQSTLQINISSASAKKGASLSSVSVNVNGTITTDTISSSSKNINIGTINLSDNATIPITITDSRGNSTTNNLTITILPYELPSAIVYLARKQNYYTETNINVDATYSSLDGNNTLTIQYRTKKTSDVNYGSYATLTNNVTTTFNADNTYSWDIQVLLTDAIGSTTYNLAIGIGTPLFFIDKKKRSLGFLGLPQHQGSLEVNGGLYYKDFYGNMVNLSSTLTGVKLLGFSSRTNLTIYTDNGYGLVFIVSSYYVMMISLQKGTQTTTTVFGTPPTLTYTWDGTSSLSIIGFETWNHHIAIGSDHISRIE